jgi:hypothetical protein
VLGDADGLAEGLRLGLALGLADGLRLGLADGLRLGLADGLAEGLRLGLALGLKDGETETVNGRMPNTTPVLPASVVDTDAHVLAAIAVPSESPDVIAMVQSEPSEVSKSNRLVHTGFRLAAIVPNVVAS